MVDNLNRATSIQGVSCTNDLLGNRTYKTGVATYLWDPVNRMTSHNGSPDSLPHRRLISLTSFGGISFADNYSYRADGLRVRKKIGYNTNTWVYARDGQMGFEDACYSNASGSFALTTWNDYALGARGIDRWTNSFPTSSTTFYPIFDPHGNQVSYISKTASAYWQAPQRSFDPWGNLRLGSAGNQPNGRYCANIGHENDDENTMTYMRARYYDLATGRFISQDPARERGNWFAYCNDDPVNFVDVSGRDATADWIAAFWGTIMFLSDIGVELCVNGLVGNLANLPTAGWTAATYGWVVGIAVFTVLAIWGAAEWGEAFVTALNQASYSAALSGLGDEVVATAEKLKGPSVMSILAEDMEWYAWLGIIDNGG